MLTPQKWVVCEESGHWAAALRVALGRSSDIPRPPRLREIRSLVELSVLENAGGIDLILVEVQLANLAQVLELITRFRPRRIPLVALVKDPVGQRQLADLLWEAGAVEVVDSPRRLHRLLALHDRAASVGCRAVSDSTERQSFADWAWSTLPWQDP